MPPSVTTYMLRRLCGIVGILGLFLAVGPAFGQQSTGGIQGTVIDAVTKEPLQGANVQIVGTSLGTVTNSDGFYELSNVPTGTQTVRASFIGYQAVDRAVEVLAGETVTLNFSLRPPDSYGTIEGTVFGQNEQPIEGATVTVASEGLSTTTNSNGFYQLTEVPADTQTVQVAAIGYQSSQQLVRVSANETTTANFVLTPQSPEITVIAPNGGETWTMGTTEQIQWTSEALAGDVRIDLVSGGDPFFAIEYVIASRTPNDGTFAWSIPTDLEPFSRYRIMVSSIDDELVRDPSDGPFTIQEPITGTITGTVFDAETRERLAGASVVLEGTEIGTTTDAQGDYTFSSVPEGAYTAQASLLGYQTARQEVRVVAGETSIVDFLLEAAVQAPTAVTEAATNGSADGATLNGTVNPGGAETTVTFEYFPTDNPDLSQTVTADQSPLTGTDDQAVSASVSGLDPGVQYAFRVTATNDVGSDTGADETFTTDVIAPTAQTNAAASVTEDGATLNGAVDPNGGQTTVAFEYGLSADYGSTMDAEQSPLTGDGAQAVNATLTGLESGTTYHYRVVASNVAGSDAGNDRTFTTTAPQISVTPPSLAFGDVQVGASTTDQVTVENTGDADLQISNVSIGGTDASAFSVADGESGVLEPSQTRDVILEFAPRSAGTKSASLTIESNIGSETVRLSGTGLASPTARTDPVTDVTDGGATLRGTVNPGAAETTVTFEYGLDTSYGNTIAAEQSPLTGTSDQAVSAAITELEPGTTYHVRVRASNATGEDLGEDRTFTTHTIQAPLLRVNPSELAFGVTTVGESSAPQRVILENEGNAPLTITDVTLLEGTDFRKESDTAEATLAPGATRTLDVAFVPQSSGPKSDELVVETEAAGSRSVSLTGTGGTPAMVVQPAMLDFGTVAVGDTARKTVTIENAGNVALEVHSLSIGGAPAAAFSTETPLPIEIGPEQASSVIVAFAPPSGGRIEAILELDGNAGPAAVDLNGSGVAVGLELASSSAVAGESKPLSVFTPEDFRPTDRRLFYRRGGASSYQPTELQDAGDGRFTGSIPASAVTERGVDFYVELTEGALTVTFPAERPAEKPVHLRTQSATLAAEGPFEPESYRMVSVPVVPEDGRLEAVLSEYGDYDPQRWRLLRWDPETGPNGAYRELEANRGFSTLDAAFAPGMAFWLVTREGNGFSVENGQSVDGSEPFQIVLEPGWNQVANPFAFPVAWSRITGTEEVEGPWSFDAGGGAFHPCCAQTLQPWSGYFVNNRSDAPVTLSIPPVEADAESSQPPLQADRLDDADYAVQLVAQVEGRTSLRDAQNYVGFMDEVRAGRDRMDWAEPPPVGEHVRLSVVEGEERLAGSFKPIDARGQFWDVEVAVEGSDPFQMQTTVQVRLSETGRLPEAFERHVIDRDTERALSMEGGRFSVTLSRAHPVRRLRLIVGTRALAKEKSAGASLETYTNALRPSFPNPFTKQTTIGYELKEENPVEIAIYDLLGRHVRTLVQGRRRPGTYQVQWDGRNARGAPVASGMYFYRIQAGDFTASHRMLLTR